VSFKDRHCGFTGRLCRRTESTLNTRKSVKKLLEEEEWEAADGKLPTGSIRKK
jgi:hypothetical protein